MTLQIRATVSASFLRRRAQYARIGEHAAFALLVTLAVLVLLSVLILAFFSTAILHRKISYSSSGQNRADILAKTALDTTVGDFISEIQAGSTAYTTNGISIYLPNNYSTNAVSMVPYHTVSRTLTNLVTVSQGGVPLWSGASSYNPSPGLARASSDTHYLTTAPAVGGRYISTNAWLRPELLDTNLSSQFPAPSWILISRQGPMTNGATMPALASMASPASGNPNFVIGRYAYAVYDVGGLVDVNVAGNGLAASQNAQRGRIDQAALSQLPLVDATPGDANNTAATATLVGWRSSTGQTDTNWLFNATNTFLTVDPATNSAGASDQAFVSRQDLLQYFQNAQSDPAHYPSGLNTNVLQYLTVFSREVNQPSYAPAPLTTAVWPATNVVGTRAILQAATLTGQPATGYAHGNFGLGNGTLGTGLDNKFNPSLVNMRNSSGASIFKQRFPLSRLAWITANGPSADLSSTDATIQALLADGVSQSTISAGTDANVKTYFGLKWDSTHHEYDYTSPDGSTTANIINPLGNIPAARTTGPDFFETLQAAILVGSLARDAGTVATNNSNYGRGMNCDTYIEDQNVYRHILQIGVNIIDAARPDDFPTAIRMATSAGTTVVYGVKNLPYLTRLSDLGVSDYATQKVFVYLAPEVWNPNQQVDLAPSMARPTALRIRAVGDCDNPETTSAVCTVQVSSSSSSTLTQVTDLSTAAPIQYTLAGVGNALTPTLLTASNSTGGSSFTSSGTSPVYAYARVPNWGYATPSSDGTTTTKSGTQGAYIKRYFYGFSCGSASIAATGTTNLSKIPAESGKLYALSPYFKAIVPNSFVMEYSPDGTHWYPYSTTRNLLFYLPQYNDAFSSDPDAGDDGFQGETATMLHIDPRTDRFGLWDRYGWVGYTGGIEYDPFVSQTFRHFYGVPPTSEWAKVDPGNGSFLEADYRLTGVSDHYYTANIANATPAVEVNTVGGNVFPDTAGGAFHLQGVMAITSAGNDNLSNANPGRGLYFESITDNIGPSLPNTTSANYSPNYYYDADGVARPAAGAYSFLKDGADGRPMSMSPFNGMSENYNWTYYSGTYPAAQPYTMSTSSAAAVSSQPIVLDRPFKSVGELGYVFRDLPWKDLDFFTPISGDAALLDAFSIDDTSTAVNAGATPLVAGKINLNTSNATALQALIAGAIRDDSATSSGNQVTTADATTIAKALVACTGNFTTPGQGPLASKADLALKFVGDISTASLPDSIIKARREAAIRALSDAGNVRTWNLMIDLIVQAGKYEANATTADQFVVEGEKHYWLHVAIDRYTGQVVDELLEPVYD